MAGRVFAEVIWVGCELELHSMTRVLPCMPSGVQELPTWSFDGSQTGQAPEHCSVVYLKPRSIHPDPFRLPAGQHILVLCDTFTPPQIEQDGATGQAVPHSSNNRAPCEKVMEAAAGSDPQFSVEQQFTLLDPASNWPLGVSWSDVAVAVISHSAALCKATSGRPSCYQHHRGIAPGCSCPVRLLASMLHLVPALCRLARGKSSRPRHHKLLRGRHRQCGRPQPHGGAHGGLFAGTDLNFR